LDISMTILAMARRMVSLSVVPVSTVLPNIFESLGDSKTSEKRLFRDSYQPPSPFSSSLASASSTRRPPPLLLFPFR
jgi:hypothetical protein